MNTPGDDDLTPPPGSSSPRPLDPFRDPSREPVERPRFGDGGTGQYTPDYGATPDPTHATPPPPAGPPGQYASAPPPAAAAHGAPTRTRDSRKGMIAPIAAAIVLIGGVALLIAGTGSDEPETISTPRIAEVGDPDEPTVESTVPDGSVVEPTVPEDSIAAPTVPDDSIAEPTVPVQTSPPLVEPTTIPSTEVPVGDGGPTQADLNAALLTIDDLESDDWIEQVAEFDEVCDTVPDAAEPVARADSLFGAIVLDPPGARQISHTLVTFATAEQAEAAFTSDVAELVACNATTTELDGAEYRVQVNSDSFTPEQSAAFPCADQSSFLILQLTNDELSVPYIAQSAFGFRCGRNVTITALATTIDLEDLENTDFFSAAVVSNTNAGALPGS